jgi:hypothetical protein
VSGAIRGGGGTDSSPSIGGMMAEWLFDKSGSARVILDGSMIRNNRGEVVAWIAGGNLYSLDGSHIGWVEGSVIYDRDNSAIAFTRNARGSLSGAPALSAVSAMPAFSAMPARPAFSATPAKPARSDWSNRDLEPYLRNS